MKKNEITRLLRAIDLLARPDGTTINDLGDALGCNRKSVYRLLETLEQLQFPVYDEQVPEEKSKRWRLQPDYVKRLPNMTMPELRLSFGEMLALYMLRSEAALYQGTRLEAEAQSAFDKIGTLLPASVFKQLDKIKTLFIPQSKFAKDYSGKEAIIDTLAEAMLAQKTCRVHYFSFYDETEKAYRIDPLHFFESNGGMYVFVRKTDDGNIRTLAVERIRSIEKTAEGFVYPEDFDPRQLLADSFDIIYDDPVSARIWISAPQAKYIRERRFFRSQRITENDDGSITLEIATSGTADLKRWIMTLGAEAVVLSPPDLRRQIREEIRNLADRYDKL